MTRAARCALRAEGQLEMQHVEPLGKFRMREGDHVVDRHHARHARHQRHGVCRAVHQVRPLALQQERQTRVLPGDAHGPDSRGQARGTERHVLYALGNSRRAVVRMEHDKLVSRRGSGEVAHEFAHGARHAGHFGTQRLRVNCDACPGHGSRAHAGVHFNGGCSTVS